LESDGGAPAVYIGVVGLEAQSLREVVRCALVITPTRPGVAPPGVGVGVTRVDADGLREVIDSAREVVQLEACVPSRHVRLLIPGVEPERLREVGDRAAIIALFDLRFTAGDQVVGSDLRQGDGAKQ